MIYTVKGFGIVNKAEIDVFLECSCFFHGPADVGNLISCSSAFSKTNLNIWKFMVHILLKPGLENFEHYFTSMWVQLCSSLSILWLAFLWDWDENWLFPVLWPLLSIPLISQIFLKSCLVFPILLCSLTSLHCSCNKSLIFPYYFLELCT